MKAYSEVLKILNQGKLNLEHKIKKLEFKLNPNLQKITDRRKLIESKMNDIPNQMRKVKSLKELNDLDLEYENLKKDYLSLEKKIVKNITTNQIDNHLNEKYFLKSEIEKLEELIVIVSIRIKSGV